MPAGHPNVGGSGATLPATLPAGHPPIAGATPALPAGHPPVGGATGGAMGGGMAGMGAPGAASAGAATWPPDESVRVDHALPFPVPASWIGVRPSSTMRQAEFMIPPAEGDPADAIVASVFNFGADQGGDIASNIDRWVGQVAQPDGSSSQDAAKREEFAAAGFEVHWVDVPGTVLPSRMGGMGGGEALENGRLLGVILVGTGGRWFLKATGPDASIAAAAVAMRQALDAVDN
jgi:hypothetical protein